VRKLTTEPVLDRRTFGLGLGGLLTSLAMTNTRPVAAMKETPLFEISLAEWSLHRNLFAGKLDHLDFAATARELGIEAVEYVNQFFFEKAEDHAYLAEMKKRCDAEGVRSLMIMCDNEGSLGAADAAERRRSVEKHFKWADAARLLGCHSIRVNAHSEGGFEEQQKLVADGLGQLIEHAAPLGLNVMVENHGGLSSNGRWLAGVMQLVDHPRCGTLPDFGNFGDYGGHSFNEEEASYDRYEGVRELMPWALAVSAKSHSFDEAGNETKIDFARMMRIVLDAGYRGWVGVEYGGGPLPEREGIVATRKLLERVREELAPGYA
jgi:sugar phosphate isomerase/epimerase